MLFHSSVFTQGVVTSPASRFCLDWILLTFGYNSAKKRSVMEGVVETLLSLSWYSYVLLALALLVVYLWYRWVHVWWPFEQLTTCTGSCRVAYMPYSVFKKLGIPGPTPRAFLGNATDIVNVNVSAMTSDLFILFFLLKNDDFVC